MYKWIDDSKHVSNNCKMEVDERSLQMEEVFELPCLKVEKTKLLDDDDHNSYPYLLMHSFS